MVESIDWTWTVVRTPSGSKNVKESDPEYFSYELVKALQKMRSEILSRKEVYTKHCEIEERATLCHGGNPGVSVLVTIGSLPLNP
jgi:hypothetical protein